MKKIFISFNETQHCLGSVFWHGMWGFFEKVLEGRFTSRLGGGFVWLLSGLGRKGQSMFWGMANLDGFSGGRGFEFTGFVGIWEERLGIGVKVRGITFGYSMAIGPATAALERVAAGGCRVPHFEASETSPPPLLERSWGRELESRRAMGRGEELRCGRAQGWRVRFRSGGCTELRGCVGVGKGGRDHLSIGFLPVVRNVGPC